MLVLTIAVIGACASKSSNNVPPEATTTRPDTGCTSACCELPAPNTACFVEAGTMCGYAVTCTEGLVLERSTTCQGGTWKAVNDCPAVGGSDERGCPSAQPAPNTPCALDGGGTGQCGYSKTCSAKVCDGSDCQQVHQSATANCINGMWQTTVLPPC